MNLDNLNLVELNAKEVQEVEGGNPLIWFGSAMAGSFLYSVIEDWDANIDAFNAAYKRGRG